MAVLSLNTYKVYKSINSDTDDNLLSAIIDSVNRFIENYCGRTFTTYYSTDKVEYFDLEETELYPIEHPIISVNAGATFPNSLTEYTDYIIDRQFNHRILALREDSFLPYGFSNPAYMGENYNRNALKLTYKGGYSSTPKDLEHAAILLTDYFKNEDYIPRKSLSGASIDTAIQVDHSPKLPPHIRRILENYRNIVL